jgi:hypothetical protein
VLCNLKICKPFFDAGTGNAMAVIIIVFCGRLQQLDSLTQERLHFTRTVSHAATRIYFLITVSAGRVGVSTGTVDVSAGETVEGIRFESVVGASSAPLSLHAVMIPATVRITSSFFIWFAF